MIYQLCHGYIAPRHHFTHSMGSFPFQFSKFNRAPILINMTFENGKYYISKKSTDDQEASIQSVLVSVQKIHGLGTFHGTLVDQTSV
jgi:hypothetical protein